MSDNPYQSPSTLSPARAVRPQRRKPPYDVISLCFFAGLTAQFITAHPNNIALQINAFSIVMLAATLLLIALRWRFAKLLGRVYFLVIGAISLMLIAMGVGRLLHWR